MGSNGFFGALAAISTLTALFAIGEAQGEWVTRYPPIAPAQVPGVVLFWWASYGAGAWLSWLFARTLERAVHAARGQTLALAHTLKEIGPETSLDHVLQQTLSAIAQQLGVVFTALWLHDPAAGVNRIHLGLMHGEYITASEVAAAGLALRPTQEMPLWIELVRDHRPVVVTDVANDPRVQFHALLRALRVRSILHVPLLKDEQVLGFITAASADRPRFSPEDLEFAQALAQQATLTMELARLAEVNREAAVLAERNRMAREIHDTLAQGFTGIVVQLEAAEDVLAEGNDQASQHLTRARALARESLAEARRSVHALRPQALEHKPLPAALHDSVTALTADTPVQVDWHGPSDWPALPPGLETDLLRLGQEAVTNVLRHADARHLRLALRAVPGRIEMEVQDDGRGFDPALNGAHGGFGLVGMRERAARHGGTFVITSQPGHGTTIRCLIPCSP
jgi:signal transduction histidine kinase